MLLDQDHDGFYRSDTLLWEVLVGGGYKDTTLGVTFRILACDESGQLHFFAESDTFRLQTGTYQWLGVIHLSPGKHSQWDFEIDLIDPFGNIADWIPCEFDDDITNVPMERINEDPRVTTVFDPNPVQRLQQYELADRGDTNYPLLLLAYQEVQLLGLAPDQYGTYYLKGPHVQIFDTAAFFTQQAVSLDPIFPYYRCDDEFEEVMCYYHIDRSQRYLQSLGFSHACNRAIKVDAHGIADTARAHYVPNYYGTGYICFGDGGIDWAEDADVILHEYGHAVQDNQAPLVYAYGEGVTFCGNETVFMEEGFAHYWAASMTDSASAANGINPGWIAEW